MPEFNSISERNDFIIFLCREGYKIEAIAAHLEMNYAAVYKITSQHRKDTGEVFPQVSRFGRFEKTHQKIIDLLSSKEPAKDVAETLQVSLETIYRVAKANGIVLNRQVDAKAVKRRQTALELFKSNTYTRKEISEMTGLSPSRLSEVLVSHGLAYKNTSHPKPGAKPKDNPKDKSKIKTIKLGQRSIQVLELFNSGKYSQSKIARMIGISPQRVNQIIRSQKEKEKTI